MVHVHAHDCTFWLTTGFANGSGDGVQRQLQVLNMEAKEVQAKLDDAWASWIADPSNSGRQKRVEGLESRLVSLEEGRRVLEATLSGATHVDAWVLLRRMQHIQGVGQCRQTILGER